MNIDCPRHEDVKLNWEHVIVEHLNSTYLSTNMADNLIKFIDATRKAYYEGMKKLNKLKDKALFSKNFKSDLTTELLKNWKEITRAFDVMQFLLQLVPQN